MQRQLNTREETCQCSYCRQLRNKDIMTHQDFNDYQRQCVKLAIYPKELTVIYPALGLAGEVGELCNKIKKKYRDKVELNVSDMISELGDVLWYLAVLSEDLGINLSEVVDKNLEKLKVRQQKGTLGGSGDNR